MWRRAGGGGPRSEGVAGGRRLVVLVALQGEGRNANVEVGAVGPLDAERPPGRRRHREEGVSRAAKGRVGSQKVKGFTRAGVEVSLKSNINEQIACLRLTMTAKNLFSSRFGAEMAFSKHVGFFHKNSKVEGFQVSFKV